MIFHEYYSDVPRDEVDRLVASQELARLVTVGDDSVPHIGLYPFVYDGKTLDLHLVRSDEQIKDLKARPRLRSSAITRCRASTGRFCPSLNFARQRLISSVTAAS